MAYAWLTSPLDQDGVSHQRASSTTTPDSVWRTSNGLGRRHVQPHRQGQVDTQVPQQLLQTGTVDDIEATAHGRTLPKSGGPGNRYL
ncbi:MAG: hypothetical protein R3E50_11240 [Halioglobus sp.]